MSPDWQKCHQVVKNVTWSTTQSTRKRSAAASKEATVSKLRSISPDDYHDGEDGDDGDDDVDDDHYDDDWWGDGGGVEE